MALTRILLIRVMALGAVVSLGLWAAAVVSRPPASDGSAAVQTVRPHVTTSSDEVTRIILSYLDDNRPDDPLVEVRSGVWAKSSNYHGVMIGGTCYYYALLPDQSFDPLSRGAVGPGDIQIVREIHDVDSTVIIYTLARPGAGSTLG